MLHTATLVLSLFAIVVTPIPYKEYDNDFVDPSYILDKKFNPSTAAAQQSIIEWADFLASQGPWCEHSSQYLMRIQYEKRRIDCIHIL
jgi:hypothetical protein